MTWLYLFLTLCGLVICFIFAIGAILWIDSDREYREDSTLVKTTVLVVSSAGFGSLLVLTIKLIMEVFS